MQVRLDWDDRQFHDLLEAWKEPAVKKTLKAAASAYGRTMKPILVAATPAAPPGNKYAKPPNGFGAGNLRRLTRYKQFAARYGIGVVIAPMGKGAYYRRFVVKGTKPHIILPKAPGSRGQLVRALALATGDARAIHHPGAKANDYVGRAGRAGDPIAALAAELVIFGGLDAKRVIETTDL